jgi:hypothetical protein
MEQFRKLFGNYCLKETKEGPVVVTRTVTELEAIQAKAARNKLPIQVMKISPDMAQIRPRK